MFGSLSSSLYKDNTFFREIQIAFTFEYTSEMLKCSDLQQRGSAMYYITRRAPKGGIRMRVRGWDGGAEGRIPIDFVIEKNFFSFFLEIIWLYKTSYILLRCTTTLLHENTAPMYVILPLKYEIANRSRSEIFTPKSYEND